MTSCSQRAEPGHASPPRGHLGASLLHPLPPGAGSQMSYCDQHPGDCLCRGFVQAHTDSKKQNLLKPGLCGAESLNRTKPQSRERPPLVHRSRGLGRFSGDWAVWGRPLLSRCECQWPGCATCCSFASEQKRFAQLLGQHICTRAPLPSVLKVQSFSPPFRST